jgi:hypothetical protein
MGIDTFLRDYGIETEKEMMGKGISSYEWFPRNFTKSLRRELRKLLLSLTHTLLSLFHGCQISNATSWQNEVRSIATDCRVGGGGG